MRVVLFHHRVVPNIVCLEICQLLIATKVHVEFYLLFTLLTNHSIKPARVTNVVEIDGCGCIYRHSASSSIYNCRKLRFLGMN